MRTLILTANRMLKSLKEKDKVCHTTPHKPNFFTSTGITTLSNPSFTMSQFAKVSDIWYVTLTRSRKKGVMVGLAHVVDTTFITREATKTPTNTTLRANAINQHEMKHSDRSLLLQIS